MKKLIAISSAIMILSLLMAPSAFAVVSCPGGGSTCTAPDVGLGTTVALMGFLSTITSWLFYALVFMAIVFIIIGGLTYVSSKGETAAVTKAKNYIIYALIGIAVGILAKSLVLLICNVLGAGANCPVF